MEELSLVTPLGWNYVLNVPTRHINWHQNGYESFTKSLFQQFSKTSDVIIDIGAHIGFYTLLAAQANSKARLIAVEASPENVKVLEENLLINSLKAEVFNRVFSDENGVSEFSITEASDNGAVGGHPNSPTIETVFVPNMTSNLLSIKKSDRVLVKMDVEGYEYKALAGLQSLIEKCSDLRLIIEYNPDCLKRQISSPITLLEKLTELGFRLFAVSDENLSWQELDKINFIDSSILNKMGYVNIVCIKSTKSITLSGVVHHSGLYGGERHYLELVGELIASGAMVHSVLVNPDFGLEKELQAIGSSVSFVPRPAWWVNVWDQRSGNPEDPLFWERYISIPTIEALKSVNADLVLSTSVVAPQGAISAVVLSKPHIWMLQELGDVDHGWKLYLPPIEMGRLIHNISDLVLCVSEFVRSHFFPTDRKDALIVNPQPRISQIDQTSQEREFTIGVLGSMSPSKGQEDLIGALGIVLKAGFKAKLKLFGGIGEEYRSRLDSKISTLGLNDLVRFIAFENNREGIYSQIDLAVVTSRNEAFGRTPIEAAQLGIPVIYANAGGLAEYMRPEITGLPYTPGDESSLAAAIIRIISDSEFRSSLKDTARDYFARVYADNPIGLRMHEAFSEIGFKQKNLPITNAIKVAAALAERTIKFSEISKSKKIKVYFDDNYLGAFKNMIFSAVVNKRSYTNISLEVGLWGNEGVNLSAESRESILNFCRKLGVEISFLVLTRFVDRQRPKSEDYRIPLDSHYARLDMMLNADSDFIYLDVDLLLQPGWDELLYLSPSTAEVAVMGVEDLILKNLGVSHESMYGDFYFNSGVLVFFFKPWQEYGLSQKLNSIISQVDNLELKIRDSLYDQDILNVVCVNNKARLDKTFNCFIVAHPNAPAYEHYRLESEFQPKILHFATSIKPFADLGSMKFDILNIADSNSNSGYIDASQHFYYLYYFMQNRRKIWEINS